jgi:hypothetical protein
MILTTVINRQLFIQFNSWVEAGEINISDGKDFKKTVIVTNSDFEVIDIPEGIKQIKIAIETGEETINKYLVL